MDGQEFVLTVTNYAVEEDGSFTKARVTISPGMVQFIIAGTEFSHIVEGRELKKVNVVLSTENQLELFISEVDLICIERAVGTYFLP